MFIDLLRTGEKTYQQAAQQHANPQYKTAIFVLKNEKRHALRLLENQDYQQCDSPMADDDKHRLTALLERYKQPLALEDFIEIEQRLLSCLHGSLTRISPCALSLNLRKIAVRQQQCLEKLSLQQNGSGLL
ncbi:hypothetical protein GCM10011338_03510 [Alteromonas lipolytica]|uniref:DUF2383 domain-containing protein n=2 Tax=Alteromonas lipolytica TaxID=1856405 RepID=A0A1E8FHC2_9ALTE|nr:hypothetical protein BFC17_14915 [Alteromonas lipolytica]GGF54595.1 hypothetical protein GCM10011338_03510 [Alteromonas lipolytica]